MNTSKTTNYDQNFENVPRFSCEFSGECGGCNRTGLSYRRGLAEKQSKVANLLKPYVSVSRIIGMADPYHYRNKVHAVIAESHGKLYSGIYRQGTHKIVPVRNCLIEDERASEIIRDVTALAAAFRIRAFNEDSGEGLLRHVTARVARSTGEIMLTLVTSREMFPSRANFVKEILKLHPEITTITQNINQRNTSIVFGDKDISLFGHGYIEDILLGCRFRISPRSFYQVNSAGAEKLFLTARNMARLTKNDDVLDAYCGIGTIGLIMHEDCRSVTGIELNRSAVLDAKINAKLNSAINSNFFHGDAGEFMIKSAAAGRRFSCVFMDPPREGASSEFLSALLRSKPDKIVYISCNPVTLARDLAHLTRGGYRALQAVPVDMFPFTDHVETVCLLSKLQNRQHIEIELNMDELDVTDAEKKATYPEIKEYVMEHYGYKIPSLYIAQVKQKCGIIERENYNKSKYEHPRQAKCPPEKETAIMEALQHFGMI